LNVSNKIVRFEYFTAIGCDEGISVINVLKLESISSVSDIVPKIFKAEDRESLKKLEYYTESG
jgi:hypothetical protein